MAKDETSARYVIAKTLADRHHHLGTPEPTAPGIWADAGAIEKALKAAGWKLGKRDRNSRPPA